MASSYRMPLVILALLGAAASIILSAILMSANAAIASSNIFMLELDTSRVYDPVVQYAYQTMADAGLPQDNCVVEYTKRTQQRLYFNDSTAPVSRLVDTYLAHPTAESPNRALWTPEPSDTAILFAIYVSGVNETTFDQIEPTEDMMVTARNLGNTITHGANLWRTQDKDAFDATNSFRLRIVGAALSGMGFVGLAALAIAQGYLAADLIGILAGVLAVASVCQFVSAGLITSALVSMQGTYAPFQFIIPNAIATYRLSTPFLGMTWASAGLALFAALLAAMAAAQPTPPEQHRPRWRGRKNADSTSNIAPVPGPYRPLTPVQEPHMSVYGHKSISSPYNHSSTIDEAAKARGAVVTVGIGVAISEDPMPQQPSPVTGTDQYGYDTSRFSVVSSLGPTPVRTHF